MVRIAARRGRHENEPWGHGTMSQTASNPFFTPAFACTIWPASNHTHPCLRPAVMASTPVAPETA
jgi:hypothetical protein